jgi:4-amino-4-deoxy-L-arabinose transferase-like glycosyltransferase
MTPRKSRQGSDLAFTWALACVALGPRLLVALVFSHEPVWDGHYYHFGAERIAAGLGYSEDVMVHGHPVWKPWTHYPVGYSAFLGVLYRIFGSGIVVAPVANAVIGTLTAVVVHRLALHYLSETRARIAGALCALHPGLIAYSAVVMTEPLAAFLLLTAGYAAVRCRGHWAALPLTGVLLGLAALVRPASLLAVPLFFFTTPRPFLKALGRTLAVGAITLLTILPWTLRNCRVMDGCALISTNGGWNLAIGALTQDGRFRTLRAADGCPIVTGQVQQDRCWAEVGKEIIRRNPLRWLGQAPKKLSQTFDHESFAIEYLREASPEQWPEARRVAGRELLTSFHWALMVAASLSPIALVTSPRRRVARFTQGALFLSIVGYAAYCAAQPPPPPFFALMVMTPLIALLPFPGRPRQGPVGFYLLGLLGVTTLTHAVFFGDDRYHLVVTPALCILAAAALRSARPSRQNGLVARTG